MRVGFVALIFFIIILIITGSMTYPNEEDLVLMFSTFSILVMSWLFVRETKGTKKEKKKKEVKIDASEV
jgi:positive regulator of sigma E activity